MTKCCPAPTKSPVVRKSTIKKTKKLGKKITTVPLPQTVANGDPNLVPNLESHPVQPIEDLAKILVDKCLDTMPIQVIHESLDLAKEVGFRDVKHSPTSPNTRKRLLPSAWSGRLSLHPLMVTEEEFIQGIPFPDVLLSSQGLVLKHIRGDGHCILKAALESLKHTNKSKLSLDNIIHLIDSEVSDNIAHTRHKERPFLPRYLNTYWIRSTLLMLLT